MFTTIISKLMTLIDLIVTKQHTHAQQEAAANADKPQYSIDDVTSAGSVTEILDNIHDVKRKK